MPSIIEKEFSFLMNTNSPSLDASYMDFIIACESVMAYDERKDSGLAYKSAPLRISFTDSCGKSDIIAATSVDAEIPLFSRASIDFRGAVGSQEGCQPFIEDIMIIEHNAITPAVFRIDQGVKPDIFGRRRL